MIMDRKTLEVSREDEQGWYNHTKIFKINLQLRVLQIKFKTKLKKFNM